MKKTLDPAEAQDRQIFADVYRFFMKYRSAPPTEELLEAYMAEMVALSKVHDNHPLFVSMIVGASDELDRRWAAKIKEKIA